MRIETERMTMGLLLRGGVPPRRLALIMRDAAKGHRLCQHHLERAAGGPVTIKDIRDGACRITAHVTLNASFEWHDRTLYGVLPETLARAVVGRPLGEIFLHPDADPLAETIAPLQDDGLLSVERMDALPQRPTMWARVTQPAWRMREFWRQSLIDPPATRDMLRLLNLVSVLAMLSMVFRMAVPHDGVSAWFVTGMTAASAAFCFANRVNQGMHRPFSPFGAIITAEWHEERMRKICAERRDRRRLQAIHKTH